MTPKDYPFRVSTDLFPIPELFPTPFERTLRLNRRKVLIVWTWTVHSAGYLESCAHR